MRATLNKSLKQNKHFKKIPDIFGLVTIQHVKIRYVDIT